MYNEEINKTSLSSNDNKRYLDFDGTHTHPLGTNAFIVCKSESDHYLKHKKNEIILKSQQRFKREAHK